MDPDDQSADDSSISAPSYSPVIASSTHSVAQSDDNDSRHSHSDVEEPNGSISKYFAQSGMIISCVHARMACLFGKKMVEHKWAPSGKFNHI